MITHHTRYCETLRTLDFGANFVVFASPVLIGLAGTSMGCFPLNYRYRTGLNSQHWPHLVMTQGANERTAKRFATFLSSVHRRCQYLALPLLLAFSRTIQTGSECFSEENKINCTCLLRYRSIAWRVLPGVTTLPACRLPFYVPVGTPQMVHETVLPVFSTFSTTSPSFTNERAIPKEQNCTILLSRMMLF